MAATNFFRAPAAPSLLAALGQSAGARSRAACRYSFLSSFSMRSAGFTRFSPSPLPEPLDGVLHLARERKLRPICLIVSCQTFSCLPLIAGSLADPAAPLMPTGSSIVPILKAPLPSSAGASPRSSSLQRVIDPARCASSIAALPPEAARWRLPASGPGSWRRRWRCREVPESSLRCVFSPADGRAARRSARCSRLRSNLPMSMPLMAPSAVAHVHLAAQGLDRSAARRRPGRPARRRSCRAPRASRNPGRRSAAAAPRRHPASGWLRRGQPSGRCRRASARRAPAAAVELHVLQRRPSPRDP